MDHKNQHGPALVSDTGGNGRFLFPLGIILSCWVVGTLIGFLPLLGWNSSEKWERNEECYFVQVISYSYLVFLYFATIVFPSLLMAGFYGYIYHVVLIKIRQKGTLIPQGRRQSQSSRSGSLNSETRGATQMMRIMQSEKRREAKAAKKLGIIVLFFMICWMPLYTINCIQAFVTINVPGPLMDFTIILSHANSALNPLLYAYHLKEFRAAMKNALCALFGCLCCGCIQVPDPKDNLGPVSRSQTIPSLANASLNTQTGKYSIKFRKHPGGVNSSHSEGGLRISPRHVDSSQRENIILGRRSNGRNFLSTPSSDNLFPSGRNQHSPVSLALIDTPITSRFPGYCSSNHYRSREGILEEQVPIRSMYDVSGDPNHTNLRLSIYKEPVSPSRSSTFGDTVESFVMSSASRSVDSSSPIASAGKGIITNSHHDLDQDLPCNGSPPTLKWKNSSSLSVPTHE